MRILLTSATAVALLMASSALVPDALAQKGSVLAPQSGWAVTAVDQDKGTGAYCAMARRFQDDLILTFAKNRRQESSFAFEFTKGKFDTYQHFAITLDPGAGQLRSYELRPASSKAFVIRIGKDESFLTALQKTGHLRAEIGGKAYNFNLADIDKGQKELDACLAASVYPAAGGGDPMTPFPAPRGVDAQELAFLKSQIDALQIQNSKLNQQVTQTRSAQSSAGQNNTDVSGLRLDIQTLRQNNAALKAQVESLRTAQQTGGMLQQNISALRQENEQLKDIVSAKGAAGSAASLALKKLQLENKSLQAALATKGIEPSGKMQTLSARLRELEQENRKLSAGVEMARAQQGQAPAQPTDVTIQELVKENSRLKAGIVASSANQGAVSELQQSLQSLEAEKSSLNKEVASLKAALDQNGTAKAPVESLKKQIDNLEMENRHLLEALSQTRPEAGDEAESAALLQLVSGSENAQTAEASREEAEKLGAELSGIKEKNESLETRIASLQEEADRLKETNARLQEGAGDIAGGPEKRIISLEGKLAILETENAKLRSSLDVVQADAGAGHVMEEEIFFLKDENQRLQEKVAMASQEAPGQLEMVGAELENLRVKNEALRTQIAAAGESDGAQQLATKLEEVMAENLRLRTESRDEAGQAATITSLGETIQSLEQDNRRLNEALEVARAESGIESQDLALQSLQEENQRLRESLEKQVAGLDENVPAVQEKLGRLQEENITLAAQIDSLTAEIGAYQEIIARQNDEIVVLKSENKQLKQQLGGYTQEASIGKYEALQGLAQENLRLKKEIEVIKGGSASISTVSYERPVEAPVIQKASIEADIEEQFLAEQLLQISAERKPEEERVLEQIAPMAGDEMEEKIIVQEVAMQEAPVVEEVIVEKKAEKSLSSEEIKARKTAEEDAAVIAVNRRNAGRHLNKTSYDPNAEMTEAQKQEAAMTSAISTRQPEMLELELLEEIASVVESPEQEEPETVVSEAPAEEFSFPEPMKKEPLKKEEVEAVEIVEQFVQQKEPKPKLVNKVVEVPTVPMEEITALPTIAVKVEEKNAAQQAEEILSEALLAQEPKQAEIPVMPKAQEKPASSPWPVVSAVEEVPSDVLMPSPASLNKPLSAPPVLAPAVADSQPRALRPAIEERMARKASQAVSSRPMPYKSLAERINEDAVETVPTVAIATMAPVAPVVQEVQTISRPPQKVVQEPVQRIEPVSIEPVSAVPVRQATFQPVPPPVERLPRNTGAGIRTMLKNAGIPLNNEVRVVKEVSKSGVGVYQWKSADLFGSAEQHTLRNEAQFDTLVQQYIERTEARCPGDFAVLPDYTVAQPESMRIDSYEIACVGGDISSSATVVFFSANGQFTIVAHEADTAHMSTAMDIRDRLVKAIAEASS